MLIYPPFQIKELFISMCLPVCVPRYMSVYMCACAFVCVHACMCMHACMRTCKTNGNNLTYFYKFYIYGENFFLTLGDNDIQLIQVLKEEGTVIIQLQSI